MEERRTLFLEETDRPRSQWGKDVQTMINHIANPNAVGIIYGGDRGNVLYITDPAEMVLALEALGYDPVLDSPSVGDVDEH